MKLFLKILAVIAILIIITIAVRLWSPVLIGFVDSNTNRIQGISNALQILIWAGAAFWGILKWVRSGKKAKNGTEEKPPGISINQSRSVQAETYIEKVEKQTLRDPSKLKRKDLEKAYLSHLFSTAHTLSLSGIDPKAASQATSYLHLESVYTALRTLTPESHERLLRGESPGKETRHLSALEQLNKEAHLVLLGDPGSGKSTFVNFVALCLAGEALGSEEANLEQLTKPMPDEAADEEKEARRQPWDFRGIIPLRIILRDFAARGLPETAAKATANHLWNFITGELESASLKEYAPYLQKTLLKEGGLLLLDGLDEVPEGESRRSQIKQAVEDFKAVYPQCRIMITSRTYAYQKQEWRLPDFTEAILAPFNDALIERFIDNWYAHIGSIRGWHRDEYQGRAVLLKNAISQSSSLRELAERPLLLTLMASLHAWRGGSLPEKREELYDNTVDLLLDWWEMPKTVRDTAGRVKVSQPSLAEWLKVDRQKVRKLLNQLAYNAHAAQPELFGTADIPEAELVTGLLNLSRNPEVKPRYLVDYLSQRAGLLVPRGVGVYTFPHRTFQEYLAACHLTDDDFPDKVAALACEDPNRWREVLLLAGAKASRGAGANIWLLSETLCFKDCEKSAKTAKNLWGAHLAGQALAESADLSHVSERHQLKLDNVREWLVNILSQDDFPAIERITAGVNLAHLQDPRREVIDIDTMQFCFVPGGPFWMGGADKDEMAEKNEQPFHKNEQLNHDYRISRYPVSNAQFGAFVTAGGYQDESYWPEAKAAGYWQDGKVKSSWDNKLSDKPIDYGEPFNLPNHPVVGVTWYEALAFSRWLTARWQEKGFIDKTSAIRLPTEAEWEKTVRGGLEIPVAVIICPIEKLTINNYQLTINNSPYRRYPWGEEPNPNFANYSDTGIGSTSAVGCFTGGASPYGSEEMSGNVWEWCLTKWRDNYNQEADESLKGSSARVVRGGSFDDDRDYVRCSIRDGDGPGLRSGNLGFRVVLSPSSDL